MSVGVPKPSPGWRWPLWLVLTIAIVVVLAVGVLVWRPGTYSSWGFQEFRLSPADIPVGIAVSHDGTVWFTLDASDSLGLLRNGHIQKLPKGVDSVEPLGLAIDAGGRAWYTEAPKQRISRASLDGTIASFPLSTPVRGWAGSRSLLMATCGSPSRAW